MDGDQDEILLQTLELLGWRLQRIEFVVDGGVPAEEPQQKEPGTVAVRLRKMEDAVRSLASKSRVISEVLNLQARHPELFDAEHPNTTSARLPADVAPAEALAMVLAEAPTFPATASQLTSLRDLPVPSSESFASLVALQPRMDEISALQVRQAREISALRKRTALLLLRWHEVAILGQGRCWAEWDTRLRKAEREIRREEVRRLQDENGI